MHETNVDNVYVFFGPCCICSTLDHVMGMQLSYQNRQLL